MVLEKRLLENNIFQTQPLWTKFILFLVLPSLFYLKDLLKRIRSKKTFVTLFHTRSLLC